MLFYLYDDGSSIACQPSIKKNDLMVYFVFFCCAFFCCVDEIAADGIGPILFTEFTSFRKEIHTGEKIVANAKLLGLSEDKGKWKIRHEIFNEAGKVAAIIEVYGAWIDLNK